jgi:hypothetical protein
MSRDRRATDLLQRVPELFIRVLAERVQVLPQGVGEQHRILGNHSEESSATDPPESCYEPAISSQKQE